jgi:4-hydroxy-tetrahydrodipicolinate synthase
VPAQSKRGAFAGRIEMAGQRLSGGLYAAVITPFDEREEVDLGAFRAVVEYVVSEGIEGLVVAGTVGEAHALTAEERAGLWRTAVEQARGRVPVVAGTGATTTRAARRLLTLAADCGCDAAMVLTPWFEPVTAEVIEHYFVEVAEGAPLPILLYHNPSRTHVDWPPEAVAAVARRLAGAVVGYKDSAHDPARVAAVRALVPKEFVIYAGTPAERSVYAEAGANGAIDGLAGALPAECADAWAGDPRHARNVAAVQACLRRSVNFIALLKAMMCQMGLPAGKPRRPNDVFPAAELEAARAALALGGRLVASPASLLLADAPTTPVRPTGDATRSAAVHLMAPGLVERCLAAAPIRAERTPVYRGQPGQYQYNHHAAIACFDGRFFAAWSAGWVNEDAPGQTVVWSTSADGRRWSEPLEAVPTPEGRARWTCGQFWERDGRLYLLAHRTTRARYVDGEAAPGVCWPDLVLEAFLWAGDGWTPQGVILKDLYVNEGPRALPDGTYLMTGEDGRHESSVAVGGVARLDDWLLTVVAPRTGPAPIKMSEPTWYATDDGAVRLLMRDDGGSRRVWMSVSRDWARTWTPPAPTDFTDAQSKVRALRLADGRVVLVNNPSSAGERRRLLTVAVSQDGCVFSAMHVLRFDLEARARMPGMHKVPGFDYPHAVEADGRLWIIYAVNKEDIEVSAVALEDL